MTFGSKTMETIGFIGLGIMGAPMAGHLLDAGYAVVASDHRSKPPADLLAKGLKTVTGHDAVAKAAAIIITMVPDTPQVADVLVGEALVFASKAGADPAKVRLALMGGLAASRILEVHGERMIKRTFAPGFRIELHQKDLNLALEGAKALGVSLPNTSTTQQLFNSCAANGGAKEDHSALVRALERMAGHEVGEK